MKVCVIQWQTSSIYIIKVGGCVITSSVAVGDIIIRIIIPHMSCISFNCNDIKIARDGALMWWPRRYLRDYYNNNIIAHSPIDRFADNKQRRRLLDRFRYGCLLLVIVETSSFSFFQTLNLYLPFRLNSQEGIEIFISSLANSLCAPAAAHSF